MPEIDMPPASPQTPTNCRVAVLWIDWYPYHVARFTGLLQAPTLAGRVVGMEFVGGVGVHAGLKFREGLPAALPVETLMPDASWQSADKLKLSRLVWQRLSALDPETVLVPGYYTLPAIAAALWARVHGRKSVLMTESCAYDHKRTGWKEELKSIALRLLFGWAVAGGKDHLDYLQQLGFPRDRTARFYDVVDNSMYAEGAAAARQNSAAADHGLPENYFLFVGRVAPEKNVHGLLAAWLGYRSQGGTWPLVIAGDGPNMQMLRVLLQDSPYRADVHFLGLRTSAQLLPLYAFASCFVLPSTLEPWGLVVNEAMAASVPVLVSNRCGCARDLVQHGSTGWVFDPAEERLLVRHLQAIEAMPISERKSVGASGAQRVQMYSPERFGTEVASIADARGTLSGLQRATGESR